MRVSDQHTAVAMLVGHICAMCILVAEAAPRAKSPPAASKAVPVSQRSASKHPPNAAFSTTTTTSVVKLSKQAGKMASTTTSASPIPIRPITLPSSSAGKAAKPATTTPAAMAMKMPSSSAAKAAKPVTTTPAASAAKTPSSSAAKAAKPRTTTPAAAAMKMPKAAKPMTTTPASVAKSAAAKSATSSAAKSATRAGKRVATQITSAGEAVPNGAPGPDASSRSQPMRQSSRSVEFEHANVRDLLVKELFLGDDPLDAQSDMSNEFVALDDAMTHVSEKDIDMVLEFAPQPVNFWLELGTFEGGSAILTAKRVARRAAEAGTKKNTAVLTVDTFLGDTRVLWGAPPLERRKMLRPDGTVSLYERSRKFIKKSGHADAILPFPATSIVALRVVAGLVGRGVVPPPQVIYLDSAHEEGEVFLELEVAWKVLPIGGIMFGDDWVLPPADLHIAGGHPDGNMVRRDVLRFAEAHENELDDTFGPQVQPMRTLGRARPGLFVSYQSFQWFTRKLADSSNDAPVGLPSSESGGFDCWSDGFDSRECCDTERFGPGGNSECWDLVFTFEQCCH